MRKLRSIQYFVLRQITFYCAPKHPNMPIQRQEEAEDAMKKLENVTKDSKREMDILDALDEVAS